MGTYTALLVVIDTTACDPIDSFFVEIVFDSRVEAGAFDEVVEGCAPVTIERTASPINATSFVWRFSDGSSSTDTTIART